MSNLMMNVNSVVTMSSREIADLVESRHDHVKRSIERLAESGVIQLPPMEEVKNHLGQTVQEYRINKRDSYVVVAQLSPAFTARLVDRWQELENKSAFQIPSTLSGALMLAAKQAEQIEQQQALIKQQAPAVAAIARIEASEGSLCVTSTAKIIDVKPSKLFDVMQNGWIFKRTAGEPWEAYQNKIDAGYLEMTEDTITRNGKDKRIKSLRVTPKGHAKLAAIVGATV